ncbi:polysaccharide pyruvyl transferase family protein [Halonotius sp. GCM10025705]|uniref:polysaccharide pyruvyl transferase family protein n=1 Tax=Halonotius sp. GCM10025705 TaxID=3252678 RepID=UPI003611DA19
MLDAGVPIYPLGPGWKGTSEEEYSFTSESIQMFERIHELIEFSGVRDLPTKRVLQKHGIDNVELVGCPAWYALDKLEHSFYKPESVDSLVISTAVPRSRYYRKQFRYLLSRVANEYPDTDLYCSFHRGIYSDEHTPFIRSLHLRRFKWVAERNGYTIINPAYDIEKIEQYREIDVHIGFRVHGHIYFLAQGHPSYLFQVDGRGTGVSESLNTPSDVQSFAQDSYKQPVEEILDNLESDLNDGFSQFDRVSKRLKHVRPKMIELIESLPSNLGRSR